MPNDRGALPPLLCRWALAIASRLVPRRMRADWQKQWEPNLRAWWILVQRGELSRSAFSVLLPYYGAAFEDSLSRRFGELNLRQWLRGPALVLTLIAATVLAAAVLSGGFAVTRSLVVLARHAQVGDATAEGASAVLVPYAVPIVFALATGAVLVAVGRLSLQGYGWRYWLFLSGKIVAILTIVPLVWIEGGTAMRSQLSHPGLRILGGGLVLTIVFIVGFGCALLWAFADQQKRCPVCLRLLSMPVSFGSWASVFEPATIELLCEEGHGSLCLSETAAGDRDRWTALDESWRDCFHTAGAGNGNTATTI